MAFKLIVVLALAAVANAGHLAVAPAYAHGAYSVAAPAQAYVKTVAAAPAILKTVQYEAPAQYDFSYGVSDPLTGDHKSQAESRHGDNVHGSYSLIDSDGFKRTVEYTADEHNGFNAIVHREPLAHAVAAPVAKVVAPVAQYAPAQYAPVSKVVAGAPVHYAAGPVGYATPIAKVAAPLVAAAHYAPSVVASAAHYAPASYTSYGAHAVHAYHH